MSKSIDKLISAKAANASLLDQLQRENEALKVANKELTQALECQVAVEQQLITTQQELEAVNASKATHIAMASHDLLQPMNAAKLFLTELIGKHKDVANDEVLCSLASSLNNMSALLDSLIHIAKLNTHGITPRQESFCIHDLLAHLSAEFSLKADNHNLCFRSIDCSNIWVRSDSQLLMRILRNFLNNAFRYAAKGRILLGCRRRVNGLEIQVIDNGIGISRDTQATIFNEFTRGTNTNTHDQGLGLGLAIVAKIAELLGHQIICRSELGKGSVFSVLVPYGSARDNSTRDVVSQKVSETPFQGKKITLLGAHDLASETLKSLVEQWGGTVTLETSFPKAINDTCDVCIVHSRYSSSLSVNWLACNNTRPIVVFVEGNLSVWRDKLMLKDVYVLQVSSQPVKLKTILQRVLIDKCE